LFFVIYVRELSFLCFFARHLLFAIATICYRQSIEIAIGVQPQAA